MLHVHKILLKLSLLMPGAFYITLQFTLPFHVNRHIIHYFSGSALIFGFHQCRFSIPIASLDLQRRVVPAQRRSGG